LSGEKQKRTGYAEVKKNIWYKTFGVIGVVIMVLLAGYGMFFIVLLFLYSKWLRIICGAILLFILFGVTEDIAERLFRKIQNRKMKKRFDELQFDAERKKFERAEEYRLNYVVKHRDEIISHRRSTEEEHKQLFFLEKKFIEFCKAQKGGEEVVAYLLEPFERLKMALEMDMRRPEPGSLVDQMNQAIENIWVDESTGLLRFSLRKEFAQQHENASNFSEALKIVEQTFSQIRQNSYNRLKEMGNG